MNVGDRIRIAGYGGTWTVTAIALLPVAQTLAWSKWSRDLFKRRVVVWKEPAPCACGKMLKCRRVFALATEGTRITVRECACEVV